MSRTGMAAATAMTAILVASGWRAAASDALAPAAVELPSPTGRYSVGTTSWRLTDRSRPETFSTSGAFRQVEVLAWYPAVAPRRGRLAPYLREGVVEVRGFAKLFGAEAAFDGLESVRTHA